MKNKKIQIAKKMIKSIDKNINVTVEKKRNRGLTCDLSNNIIYLGLNNEKLSDKVFNDYVNELEPNFFQKYQISTWLLGVLHEVGHIMTHEEDLEDDYNFSVKLLEELQQKDKLTRQETCYFYCRLELEKRATQWAIDYVKEIAV